jgi:hypothetical protein
MRLVKVKPDDPYIRRCLASTDEYNFTFVDLGINEYNLNIFVGTDKFKKTDEIMTFSCSAYSPKKATKKLVD